MQGRWLEQAGFAIHTPIKVRVMEGCLVLTVEEA
ncbi:MAG: type I toxin-antitoxin system SymE family toxin [Candidatus Thiodiazotropha sp. (ex Epidulcina cf. delphinae)]|nr:type I toxin-antitoxin system SymE family toxin [Candidatus Thiodiazotropha sp. (ex Epidulcina cf. delphinae)]